MMCTCSHPPNTKYNVSNNSRLPLHLDIVSACFLFLSVLSSSYLAFLAGQNARLSYDSELAASMEPTQAFGMSDERVEPSTPNHINNVGVAEDARLPSGQHLFIDVQNVNPILLSSERHLANVMIALINNASPQLTMLSYHCHTLSSTMGGVTCISVLPDGHMAIHTWPKDGVLALDLFTQNDNVDLISMPPLLEQLFFMESASDNNSTLEQHSTSGPKLHWGHKLRGFRTGFHNYQRDKNPFDQEFGDDILRRRDFTHKKPLVSMKTKYQHVDIYELLHGKGTVYAALGKPTTKSTSLTGDDEYYNIGPDRALFIDGVLQSSLYGEAAYHEALVHPALLSHPNPRRVAIIGGGEGATLREVLKHNTIEEAVMIEIDGKLTNVSRTFLPEWSDCSDILVVGSESEEEATATSTLSCFDDPRATVYFEDAFGFFMDEFGGEINDDDGIGGTKNGGTTADDDDDGEELFDVIIMDALDPDDFGDFVDKLYNDTEFIRSLYNGLTENGVLIAQVGSIPSYSEPPDEMSVFYNRAHMIHKLEEVGFQSIHTYDESHCHFYTPWQFLVAFKGDHSNKLSRANNYWHHHNRKNSAEIEIDLHQRLHRTKHGKPVLRYFDGDTMRGYQIPPKVVEVNHCRVENAPSECQQQRLEELVDSSISGYASAVSNLYGQVDDAIPSVSTIAQAGCNGTFSSYDSNTSVYSPVIDRHRDKSSCEVTRSSDGVHA